MLLLYFEHITGTTLAINYDINIFIFHKWISLYDT